jgi:hypothetical protein
MPEVLSREGLPILTDFAGGKGTPLVINVDNGRGYVLRDDNEIVPLNGIYVYADDYTTVQAAIDDTPEGGTVLFGYKEYTFSSLTITKTITLRGVGWHTSVQAGFGDSGYTTGMKGTVIRSTATSGNAITCKTIGKAPRFEKLAIVGPGTGTSTAIAFGDANNYQVWGRWSDVFIANFYQGVMMINVEDYTFDSVRLRGISTEALVFDDGGAATANTNQNVFINLEVQHSGTGLKLTEAADNLFIGGLFQNCTKAIQFKASAFGIVAGTTFNGIWMEANTTDIEWDVTDGGPINTQFINTHMGGSGAAWTVTGSGSNVSWLTLINNEWAGRDITLAAGRFFRYIGMGNRINSFTNNVGDQIMVLEPNNEASLVYTTGISGTEFNARNLRGSVTFTGAATKAVTFGTAESDTTYFVAISGNINETFWVTSKTTGGFTMNSSNAASVATVDWILIR